MYHQALVLYRALPGEREARLAAKGVNMTDVEWAELSKRKALTDNSGAFSATVLAISAGKRAAAADSILSQDAGYTLSTERDSPAWYDNKTKRIHLNPLVIAEETHNFSDAAREAYLDRILLHEEIHAADFANSTEADFAEYGAAMTEDDFKWIADLYFHGDRSEEHTSELQSH